MVLVVLLFLKTWRATLVPVVAIPVSLIGTFAMMQAFGFSLNMLTLFGLVLAVGIVVDDAIVVVENVERKLKEGLTPLEAARVSMDEVGTALVAIALVLLAVFVPTTFIGGITGQFYRQFAITIATATAISLLLSLTLSPALCAMLFRPHGSGHEQSSALMRPVHAFFRSFDNGFDAMARGYGWLVRRLARAWVPVLICYVVLLTFGTWFVARQPSGFIPNMDRAILIISLQLPPGASLQRTDAIVRQATEILLAEPGVQYSNAFAGRNAATFTAATNAGLLFLVLDDFEERHRLGQTIDKIAQSLRTKLAQQIQDAQALVFIPPPVRGVGAAAGFSMRLQDTLGMPASDFARATQEFVAEANRTPGITNVFTTFAAATPQVFVDVDRDKAQMLKVPVTNIFEAMRVFMGSAYVNDFNMFGRTYRVTAQADGEYRLDQESVSKIRVRNADGDMVPLGSLVTFQEIAGPERVPRYNLFPSAEVQGSALAGISSGQALQIMRALAAGEAAPRRHLRVDRSLLSGGQGRAHRLLHLRAERDLRVPGARRAVRELGAAAGDPADRADVPALGCVRRVAARARDQHPHPDRVRGADRAGGQERDPDRGVRAPARGAGQGYDLGRRRGVPAAPAADPDDIAGVHPGRGAAVSGGRRGGGDAHRARHRRVLGHDRRDAVRPDLHAGVLRGHSPAGGDQAGRGRRGAEAGGTRSGGVIEIECRFA